MTGIEMFELAGLLLILAVVLTLGRFFFRKVYEAWNYAMGRVLFFLKSYNDLRKP